MDAIFTPTPGTSGVPKPLVVGKEVILTPQGSLKVINDILLEKSPSGRLRNFRPETMSVGDGISFIDESESRPTPRNLFHSSSVDEGHIFDEPLAEALPEDSGSEADDVEDGITLEDLQRFLEAEEPENEDVSEELKWSEDYVNFSGVKEEFHESVGPKIVGTRPFELFQQIWDQPLMEAIARETNRYAWQNIAPHFEVEDGVAGRSRMRLWTETSVGELYRLLSLIILMGMCVRGRIDEYWTTDILGMPLFR